jgi:integrase
MRALAWSDVRQDKRQICVERNDWQGHVSSTEEGRLRYVPMTTRLAEALRAHRHLKGPLVLNRDTGKPLTDSAVREAVGRAARSAGLSNNGPHILRHTFCSHLAMRERPLVRFRNSQVTGI